MRRGRVHRLATAAERVRVEHVRVAAIVHRIEADAEVVLLAQQIAAHLIGVDAFDQPAVEEGKVLAKQYLAGKG